MAATHTALRRAGKDVLQAKPPRVHVELSGLPRTALPHDLRRLCGKSKVENVGSVAIDYERFRPTGKGILTFSLPEYAAAAYKALNSTVVGGKRVQARPISIVPEIPRSRGIKGRLEAAQRGIITGNGPSGGVTSSGRNVVLYGLPAKVIPAVLVEALRSFKLAGTEFGKEVVVKLETQNQVTTSSRFLVRMSSISEAYRLVRTFHMQLWRPDLHGDKFLLRAFVVW
ncbi:hypothetical protein BD414DRAFT_512189 [Trametes punicea]|nr:hypothetical protein BD414DRAFT_512189 [Trametes punicea]